MCGEYVKQMALRHAGAMAEFETKAKHIADLELKTAKVRMLLTGFKVTLSLQSAELQPSACRALFRKNGGNQPSHPKRGRSVLHVCSSWRNTMLSEQPAHATYQNALVPPGLFDYARSSAKRGVCWPHLSRSRLEDEY